jgi:hypothetical protein
MIQLLAVFLWLVNPAISGSVDEAEYIRLQSEMQMMADRKAWAGVETAYRRCVALKLALSFNDHLLGAYASQAKGDIAATRARLWAAHQLEEDKTVIDWMWSIDTSFAVVTLRADPADALSYHGNTFHPHMARILKVAQQLLTQGLPFEGYLLPGPYALGEIQFELATNSPGQQIDARTPVAGRSRRVSRR